MDATAFGFVGLGNMGGPMAMRLAGCGVKLTVFDVSAAMTEVFAARGIAVAASLAEVAQSCDVVMTCLPTAAACRSVAAALLDEDKRRVSVYAETSTIGSAAVRELAAMLAPGGIAIVDTPISGGPRGAEDGSLTCLVAGPAAAVARTRPALAALGRNVFELGESPGLAQTMKLGNNLLAAANLALASEVVRLLEAAGIPPETAIAAINVSTGRTRATELVFPGQILSGQFAQGARLEILAKDTDLLVAEADAWRTDATIARAVRDVWAGAEADGRGRQDITQIYDWAGRRVAG